MAQLVTPAEATTEQLRDVHTEEYLSKLHSSSAKVASVVDMPPLAFVPHCLLQQKVLPAGHGCSYSDGSPAAGSRVIPSLPCKTAGAGYRCVVVTDIFCNRRC